MQHPTRNCVYKEAEVVYDRKLDYPELINTAVNKYLAEGYPRDNGLFATSLIVIKNNNDNCINLFKTWSDEYVNGSRRDQLSVNYSLWKYRKNGNNINVKVMPWDALGSCKYIEAYWHKNMKGRTVE